MFRSPDANPDRRPVPQPQPQPLLLLVLLLRVRMPLLLRVRVRVRVRVPLLLRVRVLLLLLRVSRLVHPWSWITPGPGRHAACLRTGPSDEWLGARCRGVRALRECRQRRYRRGK